MSILQNNRLIIGLGALFLTASLSQDASPPEPPPFKKVDQAIAELAPKILQRTVAAGQVIGLGPTRQSCSQLKSASSIVDAALTSIELEVTLVEFRRAAPVPEIESISRGVANLRRTAPEITGAIDSCDRLFPR